MYDDVKCPVIFLHVIPVLFMRICFPYEYNLSMGLMMYSYWSNASLNITPISSCLHHSITAITVRNSTANNLIHDKKPHVFAVDHNVLFL